MNVLYVIVGAVHFWLAAECTYDFIRHWRRGMANGWASELPLPVFFAVSAFLMLRQVQP